MVTPGELSLVVSWTRVTDATGYIVQWKSGTESFGTARQQVITSGGTTTTTIPNLTAGTEYTVRVIATRSGASNGQPSAGVMGTPTESTMPPGQITPPGKVTGVTVTPGVGELSVSWTRVTDATGYKVQWTRNREGGFLEGSRIFDTRQQEITGNSMTTYTIPDLIRRRPVHGGSDSDKDRCR